MSTINTKYSVNVLQNVDSLLGEGVIWHPTEKVFYWIDITGMILHRLNLTTLTDEIFKTDSMIGTVVPLEKGGVVIAKENGIFIVDQERFENIIDFPVENQTRLRFNDGKCDPGGRLWVGTMDKQADPFRGSLYMLDKKEWIPKIEQTTISNGIAWSNDNSKMYYIDSYDQSIYSFEFKIESGAIKNKKVLVKIPKSMGTPDGMSIDINNNLWVAMWGGFSVICFSSDTGIILDRIDLPVPFVTSCAFGGTTMNTLVITTAKEGMSSDELNKYPLSGKVFYVDLSVSGINSIFFST